MSAGTRLDIRIAATDHELQIAAAAESQCSGTAHIELALDEVDIDLVLLVQGKESVRHRIGSLSLAVIHYSEAWVLAGACSSEGDSARHFSTPLVGPIGDMSQTIGFRSVPVEELSDRLRDTPWSL